MVERLADKKIRVLKHLIEADKKDGDNFLANGLYLDTFKAKVTLEEANRILRSLGLKVTSQIEIPLFGSNGEELGGTGEYLIDIDINEDKKEYLVTELEKGQKLYPKRKKPAVRAKSLELIAKKIGDSDTGTNLVNFLKSCGVSESLIVYPNAKWRMVFDALEYLSMSAREDDREAFSKVIGEVTHPLRHNGDDLKAHILRGEIDSLLKWDNYGIAYDEADGIYLALPKMEEDEAKIIESIEVEDYNKSLELESEKELEFLSQPENKERVSLLRKSYQALINVVSVFCENPSNPTPELNENFQFLYRQVNKAVAELRLWKINETPFSRNIHFFCLPFANLYSAEQAYKKMGQDLSWQELRPSMFAMLGDIEDIYRDVQGEDVLSEPDVQKKLNEIQLHLSELKKEAQEETEKSAQEKSYPKIEVFGKVKLEGLENEKSENKFPKKLPADATWQNFIIKFEDDENVLISFRNFSHSANYKEMGLVGKGKNPGPSEAWNFLKVLSLQNGEISIRDEEARDRYKKQKEILSNALKDYFRLDYPPFFPYKSSSEKEGNSYKIKLTLIPPPKDNLEEKEEEEGDDFGIKESLEKQTPQVYEE